MALVLVVITGLLAAVVANYRISQEGRGSQDARATNQPSTQSLPADTTPIHTVGVSSTGYRGAKHPSTGNRGKKHHNRRCAKCGGQLHSVKPWR